MDQFKEFFNFDNVGRKIKNFTKWMCWISIIAIWIAVIVCIIVSMTDEPYGLGIGAIVGGGILTFITWVGSWITYGFGEIVENNTNNTKNTKKDKKEIFLESGKSMSSCDWCDKSVETIYYIKDDKGFEWKICGDCRRKWESQKVNSKNMER